MKLSPATHCQGALGSRVGYETPLAWLFCQIAGTQRQCPWGPGETSPPPGTTALGSTRSRTFPADPRH